MKKVASITFGCKINQYETSCILDDFRKNGFEIVPYTEKADVYIINSCTVTNRTDYKSRNAVRKALKQKELDSSVKIVITGCYSQRNKGKVKELGDIDFIIDNNKKNKIWQILQDNENNFEDIMLAKEFPEQSTETILDKSRAFIKVQDGCNFYCSYCAIPYARGLPRSRKREKIVNQIKKLTQNGFKEFVIGGINLGLYEDDFKENYDLTDLLIDLEKIEKVKLLRISSIEPLLFTDKLVDFAANSKKLCPHFHIPLQTGSDALLKSMNRHYKVEDYRELIAEIHKSIPNAAIGIDLISGLPGETNELFDETYKFLSSLDFTYLHAFSYSERLGTKTAQMSGKVKGDVIQKRTNKLMKLSELKKDKYINKIISKKVILKGIVESEVDNYYTALSDHYIRIYFKGECLNEKEFLTFEPIGKFRDGIKCQIQREDFTTESPEKRKKCQNLD
ncbi:MAG: tRNA (N(6)-L-threonylcarbamoyladenosine(37)-C(2))-methylthiotransferase MtaB [Candidatus Cloacimonetes bacterium]|nr:tRNA (N(6)-L-threonylcarbamoyladenosine(37)-C(2))-methylthiotransferase MtaB [Candidatus Cloacimonadota bacterium]